jgi:hypothetical protein
MTEPYSRSKFTLAEDERLRSLVSGFGEHNWQAISIRMPGRSARQCTEMWGHYLSPSLNTAIWTPEEDQLLIEKHAELGTRWVQIAKFFPNRTDGMVTNRFHLLHRREIRNEELQRTCDPVLMMMVLGICQPNPSRDDTQPIRAEPDSPSVFKPIPQMELEFDPWPETMEWDFLDFGTD